jgi:hypothetical protein
MRFNMIGTSIAVIGFSATLMTAGPVHADNPTIHQLLSQGYHIQAAYGIQPLSGRTETNLVAQGVIHFIVLQKEGQAYRCDTEKAPFSNHYRCFQILDY